MPRRLLNIGLTGMVVLVADASAAAAVVEVVPCAVKDRQIAVSPDASRLGGFLGVRLDANEANRLAIIDESRLLDGFRHRPGRQAWEGEHAGKWLDAATLAWNYTQDDRLRDKLDRVVTELGKWQLDDGYLGTYLPDQRWTEWDVWAHKYDMIGLLTYYRYTGNTNALEISRCCADLLCRTFGPESGQRDILNAGWHMGMAPTSVLEPVVLLYRYTGDQRYLDFCRYILASWETPDGPRIIWTLLSQRRVDKVGNGKAYEMLSCLNGALELYRTTGDRQLLDAALIAWQDIVDKRLYLTGAASHHEHFHNDFELPNGDANVGETCVTVTWIQFNAQLLRLTGEARFVEELERAVYNQLLGAQQPDGAGWGYYVQLEGRKPYSSDLSGHCCLSSGPRGLALVPTFAFATDNEGPVVNFLSPGTAQLLLANGTPVKIEIDSAYPVSGDVRVVLRLDRSARFTLKLRVPEWSAGATLTVNGQREESPINAGEYVALQRDWRDGDTVDLSIPMPLRPIIGEHGNKGRVAFVCGPLVLAADDSLNPGVPIGSFAICATTIADPLGGTAPASESWGQSVEAQVYSVRAVITSDADARLAGQTVPLRLVPFANAGCTKASYQVWLPLAQSPADGSSSH